MKKAAAVLYASACPTWDCRSSTQGMAELCVPLLISVVVISHQIGLNQLPHVPFPQAVFILQR